MTASIKQLDGAIFIVLELVMGAAKTLRWLTCEIQLSKVVRGVMLANDVEIINTPA